MSVLPLALVLMLPLINLIGFALIILIIWWFWLYKPKETTSDSDNLIITVANGVYSPSHIKVPAGQSVTLQFKREDPSPCAETLQFPDFQISETLPLNQLKNIELPAMPAGEYAFHCQMQMYRGYIRAVDGNPS